MSVLLEFAMFPTDKGESLSEHVSKIIAMVRDSGVAYKLTAMGTIVETETVEEALALVQRAWEVLDEAGCSRAYSSLKLDIRKGKTGRLEGKIASVEEKIGAIEQ